MKGCILVHDAINSYAYRDQDSTIVQWTVEIMRDFQDVKLQMCGYISSGRQLNDVSDTFSEYTWT